MDWFAASMFATTMKISRSLIKIGVKTLHLKLHVHLV